MNLIKFLFFSVCIFVATLVNAKHYSYCATDANHRMVCLKNSARRIISLASSATELINASGGTSKLIAVDINSNYPPSVENLIKLPSFKDINVEKIIELKPDLIVVWGGGSNQNKLFHVLTRKFKIPIFVTDPQNFAEVLGSIKELSKLMATQEIAQEQIKKLKTQLSTLKKKYSELTPISSFFEIWHDPLMTVSQNQIINEIIELCGGVNIFRSEKTRAPQVSLESVISQSPQVIFTLYSSYVKGGNHVWEHLSQIPAVKNKLIFSLETDSIVRPGPRIIESATVICEDIDKARLIYKNQNDQ